MLNDAVPVLVQGISNRYRFRCQNFTSYHNYHVPCRQTMLIPAKTFAEKSLQRIALHRLWYLFLGNRKSESRAFNLVFRNQDCNTGVATSDIILKNLLEFACAGQSQPSWKRLADAIFHFKVSGALCLLPDAHELHCGHRGFACAREIRAFWHALYYSADMYVSCQAPRLTGCRFQQGATMYW